MRRKQLYAIILAGALAAGSAPAAVFAAEGDVATMSEEGTGDATSEEAGSEDGSSDAEAPVTDGGDAADSSTDTPSDNNTTIDETPAVDNTTTDETPAAEDTTNNETPAAETQTQEQTEDNQNVATQDETLADTGFVVLGADGNEILNADGKRFENLQDAIAAVPDYSETNKEASTIQIKKSVVLDSTIEIKGKRIWIQSAAADVTITRKEDGTFKGTMFSVKGENSQLEFFADGTKDATLKVSGALPTSDGVAFDAEGAIVDVQENGEFGLNSGVTLTENSYTDGGSAINCDGGTLGLAGGTVTGNSTGDKGAVYSNADISMLGDASVNGNKNDKDKESNIYLDATAKLVLTKAEEKGIGALTGKSTFTHAGVKDGLGVISAGDTMTKDDFAAAVKNISYDDTNYEIAVGTDGVSATLKKKSSGEDPKPAPTDDYTVKYKPDTKKWLSHTSAQAKFTVTGDCEWAYIVVNTRADKKYSISLKKLSKFTKAKANTEFTVKAENVPEGAATIIVVTRLDSKTSTKDYKKAVANLREKSRPPKPQATASIRPAKTPKVTEGATVTGLEESVKFFPGKYVQFTAKGAGMDNENPVTDDVRWVPQYWTFSKDDKAEHHTNWIVGAPKGLQLKGKGSQTYRIYIYCQKQVFNGKTWVPTDVVEPYTAEFTAVEYTDKELANYIANLSGTPTPDDGDGSYDGDGSGGTDAELTATAAASAKDAGSKSKSAVSTADESPIGTMSVLAALSLLAGGYVVVRKRKKEEI